MKDFFTYVVPDLRSKFALHGQKMTVELKEVDQYSLITIYHSVRLVTKSGIKDAIAKLLSEGILSAKKGDVRFWFSEFFCVFFGNDQDINYPEYFNTDKNEFGDFRRKYFDSEF